MLPLYSLVRLKTSCQYNGLVATVIGYDFLGKYKLIIHCYGDNMITVDLEEFNLIHLGNHCEEEFIQPYIRSLIGHNIIKHVSYNTFMGYSIVFNNNSNQTLHTQTIIDNSICELYNHIQNKVFNHFTLQMLQNTFYEHLRNCLNIIKKLNTDQLMTDFDDQKIGRATGLNLYDFYQLIKNDN